jgi:hypothetical protein
MDECHQECHPPGHTFALRAGSDLKPYEWREHLGPSELLYPSSGCATPPWGAMVHSASGAPTLAESRTFGSVLAQRRQSP